MTLRLILTDVDGQGGLNVQFAPFIYVPQSNYLSTLVACQQAATSAGSSATAATGSATAAAASAQSAASSAALAQSFANLGPNTANVSLSGYCPGQITPNQYILAAVTPQAITLPVGLAGSFAFCNPAPTYALQCPIVRVRGNASLQIGTVNYAAGAYVGTFSFASAQTTQAGDIIAIVAPASQDPTFGGPSFGLAASVPVTAGTVNQVTGPYTPVTTNRDGLIVFNSATATTNILPAPTGTGGAFPSGWRSEVMNLGTGVVTLEAPAGVSLNGTVAGTHNVANGAGCRIWTDGTNWFVWG